MLRVQCVHRIEAGVFSRNRLLPTALRHARYIQRDAASVRESPVAFVFDIDGVLIQGSKVLPEAKRALKILEGDNELGIKIPYILLTNGGGVSEVERCKKLTAALEQPIGLSQYIQAHTILKSLAHKYEDDPVLVLGGREGILDVARGYGFKQPYTTLDIKAWNSSIWPFRTLTESEISSAQQVDFSKINFRAILVFHDPRDWALDTQIALDIIRSGGSIGAPHLPPSSPPTVDLVFCNPDLLWRNDFPVPRLGQGAFREAFQAVYKASTGTTYPYLQFGKPTAATYKFAEKVLEDRIVEVQGGQIRQLPQIYMIGDNPASDIAGANGAGWDSVLVHTGVYDPADGPPAHEPTFQAANVEEAVRRAISLAVHGGS